MKQVYYVSAFFANNMLVDIFGGKTMENKVIVLCGAPGSGKTTVRKYLTENFAIEPVLTHTTRPKRKGEHDGIDYWFETRETFFENHYLEYVEYDGNLYGSSYESLERIFLPMPCRSTSPYLTRMSSRYRLPSRRRWHNAGTGISWFWLVR